MLLIDVTPLRKLIHRLAIPKPMAQISIVNQLMSVDRDFEAGHAANRLPIGVVGLDPVHHPSRAIHHMARPAVLGDGITPHADPANAPQWLDLATNRRPLRLQPVHSTEVGHRLIDTP